MFVPFLKLAVFSVVVFCLFHVVSSQEDNQNETEYKIVSNFMECPGCVQQMRAPPPGLCGVRVCNCSNTGRNNLNQILHNTLSFSNIPLPRIYCTESRFVSIVWNIPENENGTTFYFLEYWMRGQDPIASDMTVCQQLTLTNLIPGTYYHMRLNSFFFVEGNHPQWSRSDITGFFTRDGDKRPLPVRNVTLESWALQQETYTANFRFFKGGREPACYYSIVAFGNDDIIEHEITDPLAPQEFSLSDLSFGQNYDVAITAFSQDYGYRMESRKTWINITVPSCTESFPNVISFSCTPDKPQNVTAEEFPKKYDPHQNSHVFNIHLFWSRPNNPPDYYVATLHIFGTDVVIKTQNISGDSTNATFEDIRLGPEYEVLLVAFSRRGQSNPAVVHRHVNGSFVPTTEQHKSLTLELVILLIVCPIIVVGIILMVAVNHFLTKRVRNKEMHKYFKELELEKSHQSVITSISSISADVEKSLDKWEIDIDKVMIKTVLGEGEFGVVRKGWFTNKSGDNTEVAIKMLKEYPTAEELKQFFQEIEIMKSVPAHPHLVSLIGCITRGKPMLIVEYCSKGDLQTYLRSAWKKITNAFMTKNQSETDMETTEIAFNKLYDFAECELDDIPQPKDLLSFARQITIGMEYLSSLKLIHRDLAARNVLVLDNHTVKISDFGLSRDVYYDNIYCKQTGGKLPIRWMALESMTHQLYTTQSDVWSFGILLWEIVTMGGTPYPGVPTQDLLELLKQGYRMEKPKNCSDELYGIMSSCWKTNPKERPTFSELRQLFDILLEQVSQYLNLDFTVSKELVPAIVNSHFNKTYFQDERYMKPLK